MISDDILALQEDLSKAFSAVLNTLEQETEQLRQDAWSLQSVIEQTNTKLPNKGIQTIHLPGQ